MLAVFAAGMVCMPGVKGSTTDFSKHKHNSMLMTMNLNSNACCHAHVYELLNRVLAAGENASLRS